MLSKMARPEGGMSVERLVIRIGNEPAVPTEFDMDFVFDLDKGTFDGLQRIFNQLDAYEDTGLKPKEIERLKGEVFGLKVDKQELEQYRALGPVDRLAAYKETGLEPEEVLPKEYAGEIMRSMILSKEYQKLGPIDRLRELAEADRDGRCVVLPAGGYADKDGENALKSATRPYRHGGKLL